uniref:Uncharacterized protein n=1 Tax=Anguilla anguilla TaxID=7936 RepID=A0A0E9P8X7_ANGAN
MSCCIALLLCLAYQRITVWCETFCEYFTHYICCTPQW